MADGTFGAEPKAVRGQTWLTSGQTWLAERTLRRGGRRIRLSLTGRLGSVPRRPEPANVADGTFGAEPKVRRRYDFDFATP